MTGATKIVAGHLGRRILQGYTWDFNPDKTSFRAAADPLDRTFAIRFKDRKAVFFVRTFEGGAERQDLTEEDQLLGWRVRVRFFRVGEPVPSPGRRW